MWSELGGLAGSALGSFGGPAGTSIGGALGSALGGHFDNKDKVTGVPTPSMNGPAEGSNYRQYMDEAYPGTTPWERLGSSGGNASSATSAQVSAQSEYARQSREMTNQRHIADGNNRANVAAASASIGPNAIRQNLAAAGFGGGSEFDTPNRVARDRLRTESPGIRRRGTKSYVGSEKFRNYAGGASHALSAGLGAVGGIAGSFLRRGRSLADGVRNVGTGSAFRSIGPRIIRRKPSVKTGY